jgi:hypothetical protein
MAWAQSGRKALMAPWRSASVTITILSLAATPQNTASSLWWGYGEGRSAAGSALRRCKSGLPFVAFANVRPAAAGSRRSLL